MYHPSLRRAATAANRLRPEPPVASVFRELFRRTLAILPHDDDHIALTGTLLLLKAAGCDVELLIATSGDNNQPHARRLVTAYERGCELRKAAKALVPREPRIAFPDQDGQLHLIPRNQMVDCFDREIAAYRPTAILLPLTSHHQDHRTVNEAGIAAARPLLPGSSLRLVALYEYPCSAVWAPPDAPAICSRMVIDISTVMEQKLEIYRKHQSQVQGRHPNHPLHPDSLRKLAALRGLETGVDYAEVLYPLRIVL